MKSVRCDVNQSGVCEKSLQWKGFVKRPVYVQNGIVSCRVWCRMSFEIPPGLTAMLQDFTVAVLRTKPPDLYKFAAEHFTKLYAEKRGSEERAGTPESEKEPRDSRKSKGVRAGFASPDSKKESSAASSAAASPGQL